MYLRSMMSRQDVRLGCQTRMSDLNARQQQCIQHRHFGALDMLPYMQDPVMVVWSDANDATAVHW